jgi:hypothetical protein
LYYWYYTIVIDTFLSSLSFFLTSPAFPAPPSQLGPTTYYLISIQFLSHPLRSLRGLLRLGHGDEVHALLNLSVKLLRLVETVGNADEEEL